MDKKVSETDTILTALLQREKEQFLLLSISNRLAGITDNAELSAVVQQLKEILGFDNFIIGVTDKNEKQYRVFYHNDQKALASFQEKELNVNDGFFNTVLMSADPVTFDLVNLMKNKAKLPCFIENGYQSGIREVIALPLQYQKNNPSIIFLFFKTQNSMGREALRLLKGLCFQMSITVSNLILIGQMELYREALENSKGQPAEEKHMQTRDGNTATTEIIGQSQEIQNVINLVNQVAPSHSGVLLLGESGTGKEIIARAIHNASFQKDKIMIKVNCAAIPSNLIESELFGHEKGSFTGATDRRIGKFELADNSTLFLDEIGELPLELQTKLLRVLQEREIERIGGKGSIKVSVRIIAATNRNLHLEVAEGRFRSDLFYRLNIFPIVLPPLRNRKGDIPILSSHFIKIQSRNIGKNITGLSSKVLEAMNRYTWPGNVRELEHMIERSILLATDTTIREMYFPEIDKKGVITDDADFQIKSLKQVEKDHILEVIKICNGRISGPNGAAIKLGIPSTTLISKMEKLGIKKEHFIASR